MHCQGRSSNLSMFVFFFNDTATTEIYTLSLHDALPIFDFTNGFHDTANAIATAVSTRAMAPRSAVALAAILNFAGAFISDRKSTRLNSSHANISYAVFCLKKKKERTKHAYPY